MVLSLSAALNSIADFYRRIYWEAPTAITHTTPGYTLSYSGVTWLHSVNHLWLHHPDALDDRLLAAAGAFFRRFGAEYSVVFDDTMLPGVATWLVSRRFGERVSNPIFALHGLPRPLHVNPAARVVRACPEHRHELLRVLYSVFFIGPETGRSIVRDEHFSDPTIRHYLAYLGEDEDAAACATILITDSIVGVWNVGTLRPFRRQGLASAILTRALREAADEGYTDSVLVASPMGRSLYEEMGYRLIGSTYNYGPLD
jgi:GNAT superfamily N-acetyltransferase